jgi:hypothetical protein
MNLLSNVFDPRTLIGALSLGVVILIFAVIAGRLVRAWYQRVGSHGHLFIDRTTAHFAEQLLQLASLLIAATLYVHLVPRCISSVPRYWQARVSYLWCLALRRGMSLDN